MKSIQIFLILVSMFLPVFAQEKDRYPSLPSQVFSTYTPATPQTYTPENMAKAGKTFLDSLDENLRKQAALDYDSHEKGIWTNVPPRGPQGGVRLGDLDEKQLKIACDFLAAVLSPQGYYKARGIPLADDRLLRNGQRRAGFGAEDYWLAVFGEPSATEPWAIQLDGHHLAINLCFHGDKMGMSPTFIGTQPRDFKLGDDEIAPMSQKDAEALKLVQSFNNTQKNEAILGKSRANLVAGAGRDGRIPKMVGVACSTFDQEQRKNLLTLIELYVGDMPSPYSDRRMKALESEIDQMKFGWWGPVKENGDFSYRLLGPTLIIEYAGQDLGGDPHDHLHSIYRDPTNEYGDGFAKQE